MMWFCSIIMLSYLHMLCHMPHAIFFCKIMLCHILIIQQHILVNPYSTTLTIIAMVYTVVYDVVYDMYLLLLLYNYT